MDADFTIPLDLVSSNNHERTIIHIDIDCFYAQVEMIRNPELRDKPLGIQQKNIVVTCNYKAREFGVGKLMAITEAYKCCPSLVLVSGEDLTHYRSFSNNVTALLQTRYSRLVERLGFDENFVDVSELVTSRAATADRKVAGHSYGDNPPEHYCTCGCTERLMIGSQIAAEMRQQIFEEYGLTTCAGISYNKVLAKLVGEIHKPNQQTTLFHAQVMDLINKLPSIRSIPGIGRQLAETLKNKLSVSSIESLQKCEVSELAAALSSQEQAQNILKLSFGIDDTEVKPSGKPQSIGLEDAFKEVRTIKDVEMKMKSLLQHLLQLLFQEDPVRCPGTLRISVRKYNKNWHEATRESRQCSIPPLPSEQISKCEEKLFPLLMELFKKIVNPHKPFHLTLLGVAFTNLIEPKKGKASILTFMEPASKKPKLTTNSNDESKASISAVQTVLPTGVDPEVFSQLPPELQQEILQGWQPQRQSEGKSTVAGKGKSKNSITNYFKK